MVHLLLERVARLVSVPWRTAELTRVNNKHAKTLVRHLISIKNEIDWFLRLTINLVQRLGSEADT